MTGEADSASASPEPTTPTSSAPTRGAGSFVVWSLVGLAAILLVAVAVVVVVASSGGGYKGVDHTITIPDGTGFRLAAGEIIELMPAEYQLKVGDSIVIENLDNRIYTVGPFLVRARETLRYTFNEIGRYTGICSLNPTGSETFIVS